MTRHRARDFWQLPPLLLALTWTGQAAAQDVPTKTVTFYNNSKSETLYPVIQAPIMKGVGVHDLWMQAQLKVDDLNERVFNTTLLYKIYVNKKTGIPPYHSVTLTIPFYTKLLSTSAENLGKVDDQFVDWWNAMRIFVFDGPDAVRAAYDYSVNRTGKVIPPIPVNPVAGAAMPTCASENMICEPLLIKAYVNGFPTSIPAQLVEYTFAAAEGPPLAKTLKVDTKIVNYNISGVDQVYLPTAIGAHGNATAANAYLGSTETVAPFRGGLDAFARGGKLWPVYVPAYYAAAHPTEPLVTPAPGGRAYPLPQIPSTNTVYAESFRDPPPAPPVLSSDTLKGIGKLGTVGERTLDLWDRCTQSTVHDTKTCREIRSVNDFFVADYDTCFPGKPLPPTEVFLRDVYGWVQFQGCGTPLSLAKGYEEVIETYCSLQYNFFLPGIKAEDVFNPYVALVHRQLQSNAYAFSIDDAVSFKSIPGDGIIVTVAGANGLEDKNQTPLPTPTTYSTYCRGSTGAGN